MRLTGNGISGRCPYDLISGGISECPRFEPRVVSGTPYGTIVTCAQARPAIYQPGSDDGQVPIFYSRCAIRSGEVEAERDFAVPLD